MQNGPLQHVHSHSEKLWWEVWTGLKAQTPSCWQSSVLVSVHPTPTTTSFTHYCILKPVCLNSIENFPAVLKLYYSIFQKCCWYCICANPPLPTCIHRKSAVWCCQFSSQCSEQSKHNTAPQCPTFSLVLCAWQSLFTVYIYTQLVASSSWNTLESEMRHCILKWMLWQFLLNDISTQNNLAALKMMAILSYSICYGLL